LRNFSQTMTFKPKERYFGPQMLNFIESKLYTDVEGTCLGSFGYIIVVVASILDI
ncbi:hypothetical protein IW262DRAFT_1245380, partial [Armillaria fumosa]